MYICLDIETTGLNPKEDHIIEIAAVIFDNNKIIKEWSSLVKPPVKIPEFTERLTGITDEMLKNAPTLSEITETLKEFVSSYPIMGHFIYFDVNFLAEKGISFKNQQLDTCQLAQVLMHTEPSYSLEVLVKKFNIKHEDAHRALDDVKANIELFWRLSSHIKALSKEEKDSIRPLLAKSTWPWSEWTLPILEEDNGNLIEATTIKESKKQSENHIDILEQVANLKAPFLLEEPTHTLKDLLDYATQLDEQAILIVPDLKKLPEDDKLGILKSPEEYIDLDRFAQYLDKPTLNGVETMLGVKCTLWLHQTKAGEKNEIKLIKDENDAWPDICCLDDDDIESFFEKAKNQAIQKPVLAISHTHFLKDQSRPNPVLKLPPNIIISQTEELISAVENAWHIILSEQSFLLNLKKIKEDNPEQKELVTQMASKITILYGFLGMVMQKYGESNDPRHPIIIEAFHRNTLEWNKVKKSAETLENALEAAGTTLNSSPRLEQFSRSLSFLIKILKTDGPILWMTLSSESMPIIHSFPDKPAEIFRQRVWPSAPSPQLFCHHGNLNDNFAFLKSELGLPSETQTSHKNTINPFPLLEVQTKIDKPASPGNIKNVVHELSLHIPNINGDMFLLVNSMAAAEQFFYGFRDLVKENERTLLVQNLDGGMGKIFMKSKNTPDKNLFVGNESLMDFLLDKGAKFSLLAIHKLPFSYPNHPIVKTRSKLYKDPFKEFTIPEAALRFHGIINRYLGNHWKDKQILLLDPRIDQYESIF
ncbi:hypothetical protein KKC94_01600 [Patescibacteria group bacterium]|nr:hypothetical protein [Patescibacteria group bacterium]